MNLAEEVFRLLLADICRSLGKLKSFWEGTGQDLPLSWRSGRLPKRAFLCLNKASLDYGS